MPPNAAVDQLMHAPPGAQVVLLLFALFLTGLWLWAQLACLFNPYLGCAGRAIWFSIIGATGPLGAIAYLLIAPKRPRY
ncbi:MAG TPA: hypothetical protein VGM19_05005 [Armatimonadota bacterium]|jgi:hypothetical protein